MKEEALSERAKAFQQEAHEFCLQASERGIRTVICFVLDDPLTSTHFGSYSGAGMTAYETIGILEATSFKIKYTFREDDEDEIERGMLE